LLDISEFTYTYIWRFGVFVFICYVKELC